MSYYNNTYRSHLSKNLNYFADDYWEFCPNTILQTLLIFTSLSVCTHLVLLRLLCYKLYVGYQMSHYFVLKLEYL
jgi:hypothetical protein